MASSALSYRSGNMGLDDSDDDERSVPDIYAAKNNSKDIYTQTREKNPERSLRSSIFPTRGGSRANTNTPQPKQDPLMSYLVNRSQAHDEYTRQQEATRRRQQCEDFDDDKSVVSTGSFFDFFTRTGGDNDDEDDDDDDNRSRATYGENKKTDRRGSVDSLFGLLNFGDDEKSVSQSKKQTPSKAPQKEKTSFESAVDQSNSVNGSKITKRAKRAGDKGDWKKAVAYYHIALVKQREYYGEDHAKTAETLNNLGLALMNMGELYGAMTALEEALEIRQKVLGAGAEEVAETTSNIWMVLKASQDQQAGGGE